MTTETLTWSFTGSSLSPTAATGGLTGGAITGQTNCTFTTISGLSYPAEPVGQAIPAGVASTTIAAAVTNAAYFSFTVTVPAGSTYAPTTVVLDVARGGTSTPRQFQFAKADGTLLDVVQTVSTQRPTFASYTCDVSGLGTLTAGSTTTIRCYVATPVVGAGLDLDNIVLSGTLTAASDWVGSNAWVGSAAWGADTAGPSGTAAFTATASLSGAGASAAAGSGTFGFTATAGLAATGSAATTALQTTGGGPAFDMRLVAYTPLGARGAVIPDLGFTVTDTTAGPTLQATVSTVIYGTLPTQLEIAVEWWNARTAAWVEGRDSRFAVTLFDADDRDRTGTVTLQGIGIGTYLLAAAALGGYTPYTSTGVKSDVAASSSTISVNGTTFTWTGHILANGDRVKVTSVGAAKNLTAGAVYFVINANQAANTFQLASVGVGGAAKNCGIASNVGLSRVCTRIVFTSGTHQFVKSDPVVLTGGAAIGLNDTTVYYVVNPTSSKIQLSEQPGGIPAELSPANTAFTSIARSIDGQRVFTNATPGTVMDAVYTEARGRGWGVGSDGTTTIGRGWSTGTDSAGAAWTSLANDPATPGAGLGFQPGTPGTQVLQALLDNQYAEWWTQARTIQLVNAGTGTDRTVGATPVRIGTTATAVKVQTDVTAVRNAVTVRGDGNILQTVTGSVGPWGRLELWETAPGTTSNAVAAKQAATDLTVNNAATVAYTVTEIAQQATWLPLADYSRGDWVAIQLAGTGWTALRCVGWTLQKDPGGTVTVTTNLANIRKDLLTRLAARTTQQTAGLSQTSTPGPAVTEGDARKAAPPLGVTASTVGTFTTDGSAAATITVRWLPVTTDINGGDLTCDDYEVWIRADGAAYGQPVGQTGGLTLDAGPYPSGKTYGVSVRARSSSGQWGELSAEIETVTAYPVTVPNPPTAPTVTGKLGTIRVAWDGLLVDPTLGNVGPENGFAYVYAAYSTTSGGVYTPAGSNMGNAGYTPITGLTIGTTYWFALFAVNRIGTVSTMSAAVSFTVVGVTGPDLTANSVTANTIAAGAITADKLDIGTVPQGTPVQRVPMPLTAQAYWVLALANTPDLGPDSGATASTTGIALAGAGSYVTVVGRTTVPRTGRLHISGLSTGTGAQFQVQYFTSSSDTTGTLDTAQALTVTGTEYTLPAAAVAYRVRVVLAAGAAGQTITAAQVFEYVGIANGQGAELSPAGLRLYDAFGNPAVSLTTSTAQYLSILDPTAADPTALAAIDAAGNISGQELSGQGFDITGTPFASTTPTSLPNSTPNGSSFGTLPLLDRLGRGPIYDVTWPTQEAVTVSTQYRRIAQDDLVLEDGRAYQFVIQDGALQCDSNASGQNVYLELRVGTAAPTAITDGTVINRAVIHNGGKGYWALPSTVWTASAAVATVDVTNRLLPAGVPIYWQLDLNAAATPSTAYTLHESGGSRGLTVLDVGSSIVTRPAGNNALADVHDYSTSGSGSTSGTGSSAGTTTYTASWSGTYAATSEGASGSLVTTSGTYNPARMYQSLFSGKAMGSLFGFAPLGLTGKTITDMQLYLSALYVNGSKVSALLNVHGYTAAPSTWANTSYPWTVYWSSASSKWVSVPSSMWAAFASGTNRGFSLGINGGSTNAAYFAGATMTNPPQLKITHS